MKLGTHVQSDKEDLKVSNSNTALLPTDRNQNFHSKGSVPYFAKYPFEIDENYYTNYI